MSKTLYPFRYRPVLRPAVASTLPPGLDWIYVEAPHVGVDRPDLPRSSYRFGVIATTRKLTVAERARFSLDEVA